jgi:hypothetical protein
MDEHRYILEPYKGINTRYQCPGCKQKEFTRYIDTRTGEYIHPTVGRCNRENNCGYHYTPKQYFQDTNIDIKTVSRFPAQRNRKQETSETQISFIPIESFKASLKEYDINNLVKFLIILFGTEKATSLIERYFIGTSRHWPGATIFWQIDIHGQIRTGKIMLYNNVTGKRIREPFPHIAWVHNVLKQPQFELKQCLFGEHLLIGNNQPVAIVESEKTAIIASGYFPQLIWLAVGSINNLNAKVCQVLLNRQVILFPDLKGFEKWENKARELSHFINVNISSLLERKASEAEKEAGLDLADYLIRFNYKDFLLANPITLTLPPIHPSEVEPCGVAQDLNGFIKGRKSKENDWDQEIIELEQSFNTIKIPSSTIMLNQCTKVLDVKKFIGSNFSFIKAHNGNKAYRSYLDQLIELRDYLTKSN